MNRPSNLSATDGWIEGSVKIHLPFTGVKVKSEEEAPEFLVEPVYYCRLTQVLISSFQEPATKLFHYILEADSRFSTWESSKRGLQLQHNDRRAWKDTISAKWAWM